MKHLILLILLVVAMPKDCFSIGGGAVGGAAMVINNSIAASRSIMRSRSQVNNSRHSGPFYGGMPSGTTGDSVVISGESMMSDESYQSGYSKGVDDVIELISQKNEFSILINGKTMTFKRTD